MKVGVDGDCDWDGDGDEAGDQERSNRGATALEGGGRLEARLVDV